MDTTGTDGDVIATAIGAAEGHTSAELVLVVADRSGSYRDVDLALGWVCGLLALGVATFTEVELPDVGPPLVALTGAGLGLALSAWLPPVRRLLTSRARRERQALEAARLAFLAEGVDGTRGRTGVLIHVSRLEQRATLVVDRAVAEAGEAVIEGWRARLEAALPGGPPAIAAAIEALGRDLGVKLPRQADDVDELPNAPRTQGGGA